MKQKVLKVHPDDNVIVALQDLPKGEKVVYNDVEYTVVDDVPAKHKFFANDMKTGDEVMMSRERVEDFFIVFACLGKRDLT